MGHSKTIKYIIRKSSNGQFLGEWHREYGAPTSINLSKWRDKFNQSLQPNGANEHIGINGWIQCKIEIFNQFTGDIVCSYNPPLFEVIN